MSSNSIFLERHKIRIPSSVYHPEAVFQFPAHKIQPVQTILKLFRVLDSSFYFTKDNTRDIK